MRTLTVKCCLVRLSCSCGYLSQSLPSHRKARQLDLPFTTMTAFWTLLFCLSPILAWTFYCCYCVFLNYLLACKIGVPSILISISHENPLWMVVDKKIFIPLFERFPYGSGRFTKYNWREWELKDKNRSHLEMGGVFFVVTPGRNWLYLCNTEALLDGFQRLVDFPRPLELYGTLSYSRSNVVVLTPSEW